MKTPLIDEFRFKFISTINRNPNHGSTIISVIIFILFFLGILIFFLLPEFFRQVLKETEIKHEAKTFTGAFLRAQQGYYFKHQKFGSTLEAIEMPPFPPKYYSAQIIKSGKIAVIHTKGIDNKKNGTQDFVGGVRYDSENELFDTIVCTADQINFPGQTIVIQQDKLQCGGDTVEAK